MADKKKSIIDEVKHIVKDPVTTIEEANERRKKVLKVLGITVAFGVGVSLLGTFVEPLQIITSILVLPTGFIILACLIMLVVLIKMKSKFKTLECPNCKTRITYGDNVKYTVLNVHTRLTSNDTQAERKEYTRVQFDCRCQNCGAEKTFIHDFCTQVVKASGTGTVTATGQNRPLEELIEGYFGNKIDIGY